MSGTSRPRRSDDSGKIMRYAKKLNERIIVDSSIPNGARSGAYGYLEECSERGITGWALNLDRTLDRMRVSAYINGHRVGGAQCNLIRADIVSIVGQRLPSGFWIRWENCSVDESILSDSDDGNCHVEIRLDDLDLPVEASVPSVAKEDLRKWILGSRAEKGGQPGALIPDLAAKLTPKGLEAHLESIPGQAVFPNVEPEDVKLIAYYLPQFHPIPENDEWWGPGFTEWTNVSQAAPQFKDHYQPHIPGELGFYDLRLAEVREAQARLAREHGIHGFCYYYYWFAGRRLLERPLLEVLESGKPDFPFCICWANENWSRRWDGSEQEILVEQIHNAQTDLEFIRDVIPLFKDPRYIRVKGAPLLVVYRVSLMPDPARTAERWREICAEHGFPDIHLCMAETFGLTEPRQYGFDSSVQFPPHGVEVRTGDLKVPEVVDGFAGELYDYEEVIKDQLAREAPSYKRFPGVMTSWDNTPRKKKAGNAFLNATPEAYEVWLRGAIDQARERLPAGERFVFINAWNEWAEGAHLEPDRKYRRGYLEATRRALKGQSDWKRSLEYATRVTALSGETKKRFLAEMRFALERMAKVNQHLIELMGENGVSKRWTRMKPGLPYGMAGCEVEKSGEGRIEYLNQHHMPYQKRVAVEGSQKLFLQGWSFCGEVELQRDTPTYLVLKNAEDGDWFHALIVERAERQDVADHYSPVSPGATLFSGIRMQVDISAVPPGLYVGAIAYRGQGKAFLAEFDGEIEVA
jgi:hypothetical protein